MRLGAVDIGTNSTRLLVADVEGRVVTPLVRRERITRLGEGVDASRTLLPEAMARVHAALAAYRDELAGAPTTVVATSATRDAANGAEFLRSLGAEFGFETRLLSGDEEAELTRLGVGATDESTLLLDVGGGSTELIAGTFHTSLDIGSVRLAERFPDALEEAAAYVSSLLPALEVRTCIGSGGTVAQLRALAGDLTADAVERQVERLAALTVDERRRLPGMNPERAPVIVTGALIVREALRRYGLPGLDYSERDLLDGVVQTMFRLRHLA